MDTGRDRRKEDLRCLAERGANQDFLRVKEVHHNRQDAANVIPHPGNNILRQQISLTRGGAEGIDR